MRPPMQLTRSSWRRAFPASGLAAALGVFAALPAGAQERRPAERSARGEPAPPLPKILHVRPGYTFQTRQNCWNPAIVDLENPGPATRAVLRIESAGERSAQALSVAREVRLPERSRTRAYLPVFPDREQPSPEKIVEYADARLGDGAAAIWSTLSLMGQILPDDRPLHLVSEAEARSYNIVKRRVSAGREQEATRAVVAPRDLPARAGDLAAADIVILGALGDHRLTTFQAEALRQWLEAGGVLAIVPGAGFDAAALGPLEPLLPVVYGPAAGVETLPALADGGAPPFAAPKGILARPMTLRAGRALLGPADAPLVAERALGEGRIIAFAFDLGDDAFQHWPGASAFWSRFVPAPPDSVRRASRRLADRAVLPPLIQELAGIEVMSRRQVRAYLVAVALLVLTPILFGRLIRRPETGWAAALLLALGAGFAALQAGRPPADATAAQLIEIYQARGRSGGGEFAAQSAFGLYAPLGGEFRVRGAGEAVLPRPGAEFATPPERFEALWSDRLEVPALRVRPRAVRAFAVECAAAGAAPEVEVAYGADGARVRVRNPGPETLEDAFVRVGRLAIPLGDVPPGVARERTARPDAPRREMVYSERAVRRLRDLARARLFAALYPPFDPDAETISPAGFARPGEGPGDWDAPTLGYWSDAPRAPIEPTAPPTARRALGFVRVAAETRFDGERVVWPRGALPMRIERRNPSTRAHADGFYTGRGADDFTLAFALPDGAPDIAVESLRVFRAFDSDDYALTVRLLPADGGAPAAVEDSDVADVAAPARFFDPRTRAVRLTAQVRPRPEAPERTWARGWIVRDLDIELAGRALGAAPAGEQRP